MAGEPLTAASLWHDVRAAIRGGQRDYTSGSLGRAILVLAVPMVLEMLMQSVFGIVDVYFVGRLGPDPVAAVGLTEAMQTLVFAVCMGLSMAAAAMVARRVGERKPEEAATAAAQAVALGILVSLPIAVIGIAFGGDLLTLMGATDAVAEVGRGYCSWIIGGNVTVVLLFLINAIFRGAGDPVLAMRALWLANLLNIALDPLLIFGWGPIPALGVTGAGIATVTGRGIGVIYQIWVLSRGSGRIRLHVGDFQLAPTILRRLVVVSSTGILQFLVGTASWVAVIRLVAHFGSDPLAGYTIAVRVLIFALLPSWGMGNAAATLVGQNLGAGKPERAERAVWRAAFANAIFLALVAIALVVSAPALIALFSDQPSVVEMGAACVRIFAYSYVFFAFGMVTVQAFNGAGDTTTPTFINLFCYWALQLPLAWLLAFRLGQGANGIFWASAVTQASLAVVGVLWFRRGTWKHRSI